MRIGIIGGAECGEPSLRAVADEGGHDLEFHRGQTSSRSSASLEAMMARCDLVVIATDVNSHGAVRLARELGRSVGREPVLCRRIGRTRLRELIAEASQRETTRAISVASQRPTVRPGAPRPSASLVA